MKTLKSKWEESYKKTAEIVKSMKQERKKHTMHSVDYNHLQSTTISFEKIPMLKVKNREVDRTTAVSDNSKDEKPVKCTVSTNTGPDVILMLNDLKHSNEDSQRREVNDELKELYKLNTKNRAYDSDDVDLLSQYSPTTAYRNTQKKEKKKINKSVHSLSQVLETQSQNPYGSTTTKLKKSRSSQRYTTTKPPKGKDTGNKLCF